MPTALGGDVQTSGSPACDSDVIQPNTPSPDPQARPSTVASAAPITATALRTSTPTGGSVGPPAARKTANGRTAPIVVFTEIEKPMSTPPSTRALSRFG